MQISMDICISVISYPLAKINIWISVYPRRYPDFISTDRTTKQATSFEQLISLKRYEAIIPLHDRSKINWDCTFFVMQYDMMTSLHHTSFAQNRAFTWATKLLLNELPLLATLQRRRPDLYKA